MDETESAVDMGNVGLDFSTDAINEGVPRMIFSGMDGWMFE